MRITEPGIYDIPAEDYHADALCETPSISAGLLKIMAEDTPLHAWTAHPRLNPNYEAKEEDKFVIGTVAHSLMLRDPKDFAILDFDDYKSNAAKSARDRARAEGIIPILEKNWVRVQAMVEAGREQMDNSPDFSGVFKNGKPEQTLVWCEGTGRDALWCRIRLDWLPDDREAPYDDYKTSEVVNPSAWVKNIMLGSMRHDIQSSFYRRGIRALGLCRQPKMRFVIQEPSDPFCISGVEVGGEIMELADRDVERAIQKWRLCRTLGYWPGYPGKFHRATAPDWLETRRMEREVADEEAIKAAGGEQAMFAASFRRQSPDPVL